MRKGYKVLGAAIALSLFSATACFAAGWNQDGAGYYYQKEDGSYYQNGIYNIGGVNYGFDANGYLAVGWKEINSKWYYFDGNGVPLVGWQQIDGAWYYLNPSANGIMKTGWLILNESTRYYLNESGVLQTGIFYLQDPESGETYAYQTRDDIVGLIRVNETITSSDGSKEIKYGPSGRMYYRTKEMQAAGIGWQIMRAGDEQAWQVSEDEENVYETLSETKDSLFTNYRDTYWREKRNGAGSSRLAKTRAAWEERARRKLSSYNLDYADIELFIDDVEGFGYSTFANNDYYPGEY